MTNDEGMTKPDTVVCYDRPVVDSSFDIRASSFVETYFDSISINSTQRLL
jgi:hypothetical protein